MAGVYLDTSALGRVMLDEPDSAAIGTALSGFDVIVSSRLLRIELHRLALRVGIPAQEAETWLDGIATIPMDDEVLQVAETVSPASVATLDAIHLATAIRLAAQGHIMSMLTFDLQLARGAREHGLDVLTPG